MFYNGTLVPKGHDDVYTLTALDQTKHHFYLQTEDAIYRAFLDPKKSLPSEDAAGKGLFFSEPLEPLMDLYDYKNVEITPECLLFMPSQLNFPLNEAGSGPCNSAHRPQATPSFATRTPTPTPTSPPTKTKRKSSGEIIGLASGGGFLAFLFIGSLVWWRSSSGLGHVPLEEEGEEAEEPPKGWKKWFGRRGTRHTRFEDEECINLDSVTARGGMDGDEVDEDEEEDEERDDQRLARRHNPKSLIVENEGEEEEMVSRMRRDEEVEEKEEIAAQVAPMKSLKEQEGGRGGRKKSTAAVEMKEMSRKGKEPEEEDDEISIDIDY
jgi:hypothetical protein